MSYKSEKGIFIVEAGVVLVALAVGLAKCGSKLGSNRDNIDTEKAFNFIIDHNQKGISLVKIDSYSNYKGQTVEFTTQDGLQVLSGIDYSELMFAKTFDEAMNRALLLAGDKGEEVISYDMNRNLDTSVDGEKNWNKNFLNLNYDFNYAITETENGVVITNISTWRDWEDDDKVQFVDEEGNVYVTTYTNTKLINSKYANEEAVYQYALSLAGSEDRIFGDIDKENQKSLKLIP